MPTENGEIGTIYIADNVDKCKRIEKLIVEGFEDGVTGNE